MVEFGEPIDYSTYVDWNEVYREPDRTTATVNTVDYSYSSGGLTLDDITYGYDKAGNILTKKVYALTYGTLGTVQETISYGYNDSTWKDLLTSYNGTLLPMIPWSI